MESCFSFLLRVYLTKIYFKSVYCWPEKGRLYITVTHSDLKKCLVAKSLPLDIDLSVCVIETRLTSDQPGVKSVGCEIMLPI